MIYYPLIGSRRRRIRRLEEDILHFRACATHATNEKDRKHYQVLEALTQRDLEALR